MSKVEVRPIEKTSWHGKKGKESFTRPKVYEALVDENRQYKVGLTPEELASLQKSFKGDLDINYSDTSVERPWWESKAAQVVLPNATKFFDDSTPIGKLHIGIMKASEFVANSLEDYNEGKYPQATHVMYDKEGEATAAASIIDLQNTAIIEASKMSKAAKTRVILILAGKNIKGLSDSTATVEMNKIIKKDAEEFLRYVRRDSEDKTIHEMVLLAIKAHILKKEGHKYVYFEDTLASSESGIIEYFKDPENQTLRLTIEERLSTK